MERLRADKTILKLNRIQQNPNRLGVVALRAQGLRGRVRGYDVLHRETMSQKNPKPNYSKLTTLKEDA